MKTWNRETNDYYSDTSSDCSGTSYNTVNEEFEAELINRSEQKCEEYLQIYLAEIRVLAEMKGKSLARRIMNMCVENKKNELA